jgi:predicted nuclease with TOPRIM domain
MDSTLLTLGLLLSLGISAAGLYLAIRKAPFDIRKLLLDTKKMEVELSDKYEEQLNRMSSYNLDLRNQIQDLRTKLDDTTQRHTVELNDIKTRYETEMSEIRAALLKTEQRAQLIEDWASRLCNQVESLGEKPVPFEPMKRNTRPR